MTSPLGERVGAGRTAEVHVWSDGWVIKLLRPGVDPAELETEAELTRVAAGAGAPAPAVDGIETVGERQGLVIEFVGTESIVPAMLAAPWKIGRWGRYLGETHAEILRCRPHGLGSVKERLAERIADAPVDDAVRAEAVKRLRSAPDGSSLLHGDFHPQNVFDTPNGPRAIDWLDATTGHPAADIVRSLWLLSPDALPEGIPHRGLTRSLMALLRARYVATVLRVMDLELADLGIWQLPVTVARLTEGIAEERTELMKAIQNSVAIESS